jgi:NTE family protein
MKRALVVSGGGSRGAFAVGAIRQLLTIFPGLDFDIYVGTSTGASIVPMAALHEFDALEKFIPPSEQKM